MKKYKKVIKALECCADFDADCENCPYVDYAKCGVKMKTDALTLLKKQRKKGKRT